MSRSHSTLPTRRAIPTTTATAYKSRPLMQTFHTSPSTSSAHDSSTIDFFYFPEVPGPASNDSFARIRVPLLPDNFAPDRSSSSLNAVEAVDEAVPRPEINIVSSHPRDVAAVAMTEVVGNEALGVDMEQLVAGFTGRTKPEGQEKGTFRVFWEGLLDDLFGAKSPKMTAA